jgi:hypothetical protein
MTLWKSVIASGEAAWRPRNILIPIRIQRNTNDAMKLDGMAQG